MRNTFSTPILLFCSLLAAGCASVPEGRRDARDPFERVNRTVYRFNDAVDRAVARPVAVVYTKVTPRPVRSGVSNFLANLSYPVVIVNDVLQAKGRQSVRDTGRLVVNTTLGIGGLFDPATRMGLTANDEDFAQTLGRWGVGAGPYVVLPVLGPSTFRETVGNFADQFAEPRTYVTGTPNRILWGANLVNRRAALLEADGVVRRAFDPYVFVRNAYLQRREFLIHDGNPPDAAVEEFEEFEEEEDPAEPAAPGN